MAKPTSYTLSSYGDMIADQHRITAYRDALISAITSGDVVIDIGAGAGILSLLACRSGAGKVHAVEPDNAILVAKAAAKANGYEDRIVCHQLISTALTLPEKAQVIVSDLRGPLPLLDHHIPSIIDARERLLAKGGRLIPERDHLYAALIEDDALYQQYQTPWLRNELGLDLHAGHSYVVNDWRKINARSEQLLTRPQQIATLDYYTIEETDLSCEFELIVTRPATAHGLLVWFDTELTQGVGFSNAPGMPPLIYGQGFFPMESPVALEVSDLITVRFSANRIDGQYVWTWLTTVTADQGKGQEKCRFKQSTFFAKPLATAKLARAAAEHIPPFSETIAIDTFCLHLVDGKTSLSDIATQLTARFPSHFGDQRSALNHAAKLLDRY